MNGAALPDGTSAKRRMRIAGKNVPPRGDRIERGTEENHPTCGFLGIGYLLPALSEFGYSETGYRLLLQETFPSWLDQIASGATTMRERWDGWQARSGIRPVQRMNSFIHFAFGAVGEWMVRYMAGIDADVHRAQLCPPGMDAWTILSSGARFSTNSFMSVMYENCAQ